MSEESKNGDDNVMLTFNDGIVNDQFENILKSYKGQHPLPKMDDITESLQNYIALFKEECTTSVDETTDKINKLDLLKHMYGIYLLLVYARGELEEGIFPEETMREFDAFIESYLGKVKGVSEKLTIEEIIAVMERETNTNGANGAAANGVNNMKGGGNPKYDPTRVGAAKGPRLANLQSRRVNVRVQKTKKRENTHQADFQLRNTLAMLANQMVEKAMKSAGVTDRNEFMDLDYEQLRKEFHDQFPERNVTFSMRGVSMPRARATPRVLFLLILIGLLKIVSGSSPTVNVDIDELPAGASGGIIDEADTNSRPGAAAAGSGAMTVRLEGSNAMTLHPAAPGSGAVAVRRGPAAYGSSGAITTALARLEEAGLEIHPQMVSGAVANLRANSIVSQLVRRGIMKGQELALAQGFPLTVPIFNIQPKVSTALIVTTASVVQAAETLRKQLIGRYPTIARHLEYISTTTVLNTLWEGNVNITPLPKGADAAFYDPKIARNKNIQAKKVELETLKKRKVELEKSIAKESVKKQRENAKRQAFEAAEASKPMLVRAARKVKETVKGVKEVLKETSDELEFTQSLGDQLVEVDDQIEELNTDITYLESLPSAVEITDERYQSSYLSKIGNRDESIQNLQISVITKDSVVKNWFTKETIPSIHIVVFQFTENDRENYFKVKPVNLPEAGRVIALRYVLANQFGNVNNLDTFIKGNFFEKLQDITKVGFFNTRAIESLPIKERTIGQAIHQQLLAYKKVTMAQIYDSLQVQLSNMGADPTAAVETREAALMVHRTMEVKMRNQEMLQLAPVDSAVNALVEITQANHVLFNRTEETEFWQKWRAQQKRVLNNAVANFGGNVTSGVNKALESVGMSVEAAGALTEGVSGGLLEFIKGFLDAKGIFLMLGLALIDFSKRAGKRNFAAQAMVGFVGYGMDGIVAASKAIPAHVAGALPKQYFAMGQMGHGLHFFISIMAYALFTTNIADFLRAPAAAPAAPATPAAPGTPLFERLRTLLMRRARASAAAPPPAAANATANAAARATAAPAATAAPPPAAALGAPAPLPNNNGNNLGGGARKPCRRRRTNRRRQNRYARRSTRKY